MKAHRAALRTIPILSQALVCSLLPVLLVCTGDWLGKKWV